MKLLLIFLIAALLFCPIVAVSISQTKISSTRNPYRTSLCSYYTRNFSSSQKQASKAIINQYNYLSTQEIQNILFEKNLFSPHTYTILAVIPHIISFVVLMVIWPALCCCCVKPQKFPICGKCRKPEMEMYTKIQLKWTSYALLFFSLVIMAGSIAALFQAPDITNYYSNIGCRFSAINDDIINGRVSQSSQSSFFVGINNLAAELDTFSSQVPTFFSDSNSSLNSSGDVRIRQSQVESLIATQYNTYTNITYTNAFTTDGTVYVNVVSAFKDLYYGPVSRNSSILGNMNNKLSTIFVQINSAIDPMLAAWNQLYPKGKLGLQSEVTQASLSMKSLTNSLNTTLNSTIGPTFDYTGTYSQLNSALKALFGFVLSMSILLTISTIILTFCTVVKIRLVIYCACGFLVFLGLVSFLLLILYAYAIPLVAHSCTYADRQFSTGNGTQVFFQRLGFGDTGDLLVQCMSNGNGKIIGRIDSNFEQSFNNIIVISTNTLNFNSLINKFNTTALSAPFTEASFIVTGVKNSSFLDLNDNISLKHISSVGRKSFSVLPVCSLSRVNADVWYPSFQTSTFSCPGGQNKHPPCSDLSDFTLCPQGCYQIYNQITSPSGDPSYSTTLQSRYNSGCNYASYITNMHANWNIPRSTNMGQVQSNLNNIQTNVNAYQTKVKSVQSEINAFKTTLQTNFNSRINQTSGSFYGVDCKAIGQSVYDAKDSVCVGLVNSLNFNLIVLGLISYGILFSACFATCAGVRHFKHLQRMQVHVGYKGVELTLSQNRVFDKH